VQGSCFAVRVSCPSDAVYRKNSDSSTSCPRWRRNPFGGASGCFPKPSMKIILKGQSPQVKAFRRRFYRSSRNMTRLHKPSPAENTSVSSPSASGVNNLTE
jgi:hypothetical protein